MSPMFVTQLNLVVTPCSLNALAILSVVPAMYGMMAHAFQSSFPSETPNISVFTFSRPMMQNTAVSHTNNMVAVPLASDFDLVHQRVFGSLFSDGARVAPTTYDWNYHALRGMFVKLNAGGSDVGDRVTCLRYAGDASDWLLMPGEDPVVVESWSTYNLLRAVELLGDEYLRARLLDDAIAMFELAHAYYEKKFGRRFIKARDLRRKRAKALVIAERFGDVYVDSRLDVIMEELGSEMDRDVTMGINFAYGLSAIAMNLCLEAVRYICHPHLGHADLRKNENMDILRSTIRLIEGQWELDKVEFAVVLAKRLFNVFCVRLMRGNCPSEVFAFAARFASSLLHHKDCNTHFYALKQQTSGFYASIRSHDAHFLACAVGCHLRSDAMMRDLLVVHRRLLKALKRGSDYAVDRLRVTSSLLYTLHAEPYDVLKETFLKISTYIAPSDARYDFFLKMALETPSDANEEGKVFSQ